MRRQKLAGHPGRNPEIVTEYGVQAFEIFRADADDRERDVVQLDGLADDVGNCSQAAQPGGIAENRDGGGPGLGVFVGKKKAAKRWMEAKGIEVIGGHEFHEDAAGLVLVDHGDGRGVGVSGKAAEGIRLLSQVPEIGEGKELKVVRLRGLLSLRGVHGGERGDGIDGQRIQNETVDHREYGGVGPDTRARVRMATPVKPGDLRRVRTA